MKEHRQFYVYILTNKTGTVLYTGVTNDLARRVLQHKQKLTGSFTARYNVDRLIYYESTPYVDDAIEREKEIKNWTRAKKLALIRSVNPTWAKLSVEP